MKHIKYFLILFFAILLDQITKALAFKYLKGTEGVTIIPNVFKLQYLENKGAAFGILQNQLIFLIIITSITLFAVGFIYFRIPMKKKYSILRITFMLLMAGAIGNFINRAFNNYVIDFFYIELINFPIFNIADCCVSAAAVLLFILLMFYYKDEDLEFLKRSSSL